MIKKCAFFKCSNREECPDRNCSGCGGAAYQNCGCDACVNQSREGDGDIEICLVALDLREADMEDMEADSGKLYKNGNLEDKKIGAALRKAADDYENGELIEVRDLLLEIINAVDEFTKSEENA